MQWIFQHARRLKICLCLSLVSTSAIGTEINSIPVVIKGQTAKEDINLIELRSDSDRIKVKTLFDLQYGKKEVYRAVNLFEQIVPKVSDTKFNAANLIFDNGMVIPMPLNSSQGPIVWLAWQRQINKKDWARDFPEIAKQSVQWRDPRPIAFRGNKVVISEKRFFPTSLWNTNEDFNPFNYAPSLVRIEIVNYQAYINQFAISSDWQAVKGQKVFENRCQFCHSIRGTGAHFGWDFVEPLAIYEKRTPESLYFHVKFPKNKALEKGLMMPQQNSMSKDEAKHLWHWLKEAASHPTKPYLKH